MATQLYAPAEDLQLAGRQVPPVGRIILNAPERGVRFEVEGGGTIGQPHLADAPNDAAVVGKPSVGLGHTNSFLGNYPCLTRKHGAAQRLLRAVSALRGCQFSR